MRLSTSTRVARPSSEVFAEFAHDPANWGELFPGFDKTGRYNTSGPHGVGARCTKRVVGLTVEETVLGWDEGVRFAFRVDRVGEPAFRAWVEEYRFEPDGGNGGLWRDWWYALGRARGLAFDVAHNIEDLLAEAGFAIHRKDRYQPIATSAEAKLVHARLRTVRRRLSPRNRRSCRANGTPPPLPALRN
ncbi:SRPBCC family protein [Mycobacterium sp. TY813]|uniref:SRPBCC family protein n=1 Tax=Mycobacterium sp. TY813 TaxID=3050579 RepID=UPI002740CB0F|nr:SRPBCC family protein [Mycobacterium sp. TY813]MDP7733067.1 SRPBCC family protein [Mycobacterium sp. TY813]